MLGIVCRLHGANLVPAFEYAIFYNPTLNFIDTATMTVRGPVHANGNIYTAPGTNATLTFYSLVSAAEWSSFLAHR